MLLLQERNLLITWILRWIRLTKLKKNVIPPDFLPVFLLKLQISTPAAKPDLFAMKLYFPVFQTRDLMEYLKLEQKRLESQQHAREIREKRIWIAFQMTIALIAAVLVIYFLKDSPAILISILYTAGLLIAFNIWNKHKDGRSPKDQ